ncbi:hypothetical protein HanRHA438_Chr10g0458771 [Helianthus annuus]|nr:hypothetical protein HanRHA438_Chr10g0458771 [Helianthus annuus]
MIHHLLCFSFLIFHLHLISYYELPARNTYNDASCLHYFHLHVHLLRFLMESLPKKFVHVIRKTRTHLFVYV